MSVSTQTELSPLAIRDLIEKWWKWLDSHGVDQAECELQFVIGMQSRSLAKSVADLHAEEKEMAYLYDEELYAAEYGYDPEYDYEGYYDVEDGEAENGEDDQAENDDTADPAEIRNDQETKEERPSILDGMD